MPDNPIVEYYRGRPIRKYPFLVLRVSVPEYKRFIDMSADKRISASEAIRNGEILCPCRGMKVEKSVYGKMS